jgi:rsbT co-antagonist protein RsbR
MTQTVEELRGELARLRDELANKNALIDTLFTHHPDGIAIADTTAKTVANAASAAVFGADSRDIDPTLWSKEYGIFGSDGVTPAAFENLPLVRAIKGESIPEELLFVRNPTRPDGVWVSIAATPLPGGGALAVSRDVTNQRRLEIDLAKRNSELADRESERTELVERLRLAIDELSTPVLEVWRDVLAVPIVGVLDTQRSARMSERVLTAVVGRRARYVIVDVTGVEVVDTATADQLMKLAAAIELLGSECIVTGIQPAVAQALVQLGVELARFRSQPTLRRAIEYCMCARDRHNEDAND